MAQQQQAAHPQQQAAPAPVKSAQQMTESELLEEVLSRSPVKRFKAIDDALQARVDQLEELLPDKMKGQGKKLIKRAMVTLARKANDYAEVTAASFVRCVLEAAELGLAIDGRLAHAVVFNNKHKDDEQSRVQKKDVFFWQKEVQMMVDYKGIKAVATRIGAIKDCWARLVNENDEIRIWEENGVSMYRHVPALVNQGGVKGVLSVILFPGGRVKHDWMTMADVANIQSRSKSFVAGFGPWKTDFGEMAKKTGIRRILKLYAEDPSVARMIELDDRDYVENETSVPPQAASLKEQIAKKAEEAKKRGRPAKTEPPKEEKDKPAPVADPEPASSTSPPNAEDDATLLDDDGDAFEPEATTPAPKPEKAATSKAAMPTVDDGVV